MARSRFVTGGLLTGLLLVIAGGALTPARPVRAQGTIAFEVPSIVDPIRAHGEPDVGINPVTGAVFVSGPMGTGMQRSAWYSSVDGGHSFRIIGTTGPTPVQPPAAPTGFLAAPGGGDTEIQFDRHGKQYFNDLVALAQLRTAVTTDDGATINQGTQGTGTAGAGVDRQWYAIYDPPPGTPKQSAYTGPTPLIYGAYNNLQVRSTPVTDQGASQWNLSNATNDPSPGGPGLVFVNAINGGPGNVTGYAPFGADGYPSIDQVTGKVFQAAGEKIGTTYSLLLNVGTPGADGTLTFLDQGASGDPTKLIHVADGLVSSPESLFTVSSIDKARNLHIAFTLDDPGSKPGARQTYITAASAASGWRQWTPPTKVSDHPELGSAVSIFPWIKAGAAGLADAVWYAQNKVSDPSSANGQVWNVYMAQAVYPVDGTGAVTGAAPSTQVVKVSPHPIHYGDVCLLGTGCINVQGNRNFADFFEVNMDRTGAAEVVYTDTSNGLYQPGLTTTGQQVDHAGGPVVTLARQSSGMGLLGTDVTGPSNAPTRSIKDATGDALFPVVKGTPIPGLDIVDTSLDLSGDSLTIKTRVVDLSNPLITGSQLVAAGDANQNAFLQFVTRWQMGNTIYYALAAIPTAAPSPATAQFSAGAAHSIDLCSVSACSPKYLYYPEAPVGTDASSGSGVTCPASPSAANPCTITVKVPLAAIGNPTPQSLLESLGTYALASSQAQAAITNAQGQADQAPLQIDGVCCLNFQAAYVPPGPATATPAAAPSPSPSPPLPNTGVAPGTGGTWWLPFVIMAPMLLLGIARRARPGAEGSR